MTCPAAIGPCSVTPDGVCIAPKALTNLALGSDVLEVTTTGFSLSWSVPGSYPATSATLLYREVDPEPRGFPYTMPFYVSENPDDMFFKRRVEGISTGTIVIDNIIRDQVYEVRYRAETSNNFGAWVQGSVSLAPLDVVTNDAGSPIVSDDDQYVTF